MAEYNIPGFQMLSLVFDGSFLTRAREPSAAEVDRVLDAACKSGKAYYSSQRAAFTSSLSPEEAAGKLRDLVANPLDEGSLAGYLRLFENKA